MSLAKEILLQHGIKNPHCLGDENGECGDSVVAAVETALKWSKSIRAAFADLLRQGPQDRIVQKLMGGGPPTTAAMMVKEIEDATERGNQFIQDCLMISMDLLKRRPKQQEG